MFDTIGTLSGVGTQAGYIDENGELPRANQALSADAIMRSMYRSFQKKYEQSYITGNFSY